MSYNIDSNKNRLKTNDAVAADVDMKSASIRSLVVVVAAAAVFG